MRGKANLKPWLMFAVFLSLITQAATMGKVIYVDDDAIGANNCSNWENTYSYIQDALSDANSPEGPVHFVDTNLKAAVENALGVTDPTPMDMLALKELHASKGEINNLIGLEYATNLQTLSIWYNQISDISPLSNLTNLQTLTLEGNRITDITPLSGLINLESLKLARNQISNILPLSNLTNLKILRLSENRISNISLLSGLINLLDLSLAKNQISDISPLSGLTNIQRLYLSDNQISNISSLSGLTNLQGMNLSNNPIGNNLSPLAGLVNLIDLGLRGNQISDISALSGLTNLQTMNLSSNPIGNNLSQLTGLANLKELSLRSNQISDISPLSELKNLLRLYLDNNQISDLSPISGLSKLKALWLDNNQISDISLVSGLINLERLKLEQNQIADISPLSGLINLQYLRLSRNMISDISPLSELTKLEELYLGNNQISDISPLSELTSLKKAYLGSNQIHDISPLSGLTSLNRLSLGYNQIIDISPLSGLTNLTYLSLSYNQIIDISPLSDLVGLEDLSLWSNPLNADAYNTYIPLLKSYGAAVSYTSTLWQTLTISSSAGGSVIKPGEGDFKYANGTILDIHASADQGHHFDEWTGTAVDAGRVADPYSTVTTVTMNWSYTLQANFNRNDPVIFYVDENATGTSDGTSWENAYTYLQDALANINTADNPIVIRVAQGVYKPNGGIVAIPEFNRRTLSFQLINEVTLAGGYAGLGESDPNTRDIELYETILSGDLNGDDIDVNDFLDFVPIMIQDPFWTEPNREDNTYHVVTGSGTDGTATINGFTVTGGNAKPIPNIHGGGMYIDAGSPTVSNCKFNRNSASRSGGGMYCDNDSNPTLTNCTFAMNSGFRGGGMSNSRCNPKLTNCLFTGNFTRSFLVPDLFPSGGAMYNAESSPALTNCIFSGNVSIPSGGAISNNYDSIPILTNCTFTGNLSHWMGGAMDSKYESNPVVINCVIWDNAPNQITGSAIVSYSNIQGGWLGAGEGNIDTDPLFAAFGYWADLNDTNIIVETNDPNSVWIDGDYHLKSQAGRFDLNTQRWVIDDITSPCIDGGNPNSPFDLERFPNGGRINMGAYGGTAEASLSLRDMQLSPFQASNPYPPNEAENIGIINAPLSWAPGLNAVSHDVYLGTNFDDVNTATLTSDPAGTYMGRLDANSFDPGWLNNDTTYYWRIDEIDEQGNKTTGGIWIFTTYYPPPPKNITCFTAETPVWVDGSLIPISKVSIEQKIYCIESIGKVEEVQEHKGTYDCYDILLQSGNFISVADSHYFLTESGRWISLQELKAGTRLQTAIGSIEIVSVTKRQTPYMGKVYNLKIEGSDKYLVGKDAIIVRDY
jgi:internalin A